ncbi:hypothetical protein FAVG1_08814 [Fusarium avenaceum]|nr:hypothetical protein FAVG1_08814 [Fusarium avenaceum]
MPRFHTTVEDGGISEISSRERKVAPPNHFTVRKVAGFIRSARAKLSGHSSDTISPEPTTTHLRLPTSPAGRATFAPRDVNTISHITVPTAGTGTEVHLDNTSAYFQDPVLIPGCSPTTYVYNHASATIQDSYEERFQEVVNLFQQNVKEHPRLAEHRHNIDYVLRVCGTSPNNSCPSIVVFCRHSEFKDLRNLLTSRELKFQYCLRQPSRIYPWKETPGRDQDHRPFFNIYFWRQSRPRTLYCGNEPVRIRRRQIETPGSMDNCSVPNANLTLLGSVVELSGAERRCSTLGCVIKVGSEFYGITTMHTFDALESPDLDNADTATDNESFYSDTPTAVVGNDVESPTHNEKMPYELDLYDATGEEHYYIDDVEYDDICEDEYDEQDPVESSSFATDDATLHPGVDSDHENNTQNLRALFPTTPQLRDTHELDLDWAIINLTHTGNSHINAFFLPEAPSDPVLLSTVAESRPCQETRVFVITAGGIIRRGSLQPSISALGGISGKVPSTLWTVVLNDQTRLTKGDSGSVVIDALSHTIYGHVVGCNPMGEIYISPYASILKQIQHRFPGVVVTLAESVNNIGQVSACSGAMERPALIPDGGVSSKSHAFDEALVCLQGISAPPGTSNPGTETSSAEDCEMALLPSEVQRRCLRPPHAPVPSTEIQLFRDSIPHAPCHLLDGFPAYVQANLVPGVNGNGEMVSYISTSSLVDYWTTTHSSQDLMFWEPPALRIGDETDGGNLTIFSILVYIGMASSISWFYSHGLDDKDLPLSHEDLPADCPWTDSFVSEQWKFCPFMLSKDGTFDRQLSPRTILPVIYEKQLTTGDVGPKSVMTWKVWVSSEHISKALGSDWLVFKIFEGTSAYTSYSAEASIYARLGDNTYDHITRSFGGFSFRATQKCIMIMEYAEWGSLLDLFQSTLSPKGADGLYRLWCEMLSLLDALQVFYEGFASEEGYYEFSSLLSCVEELHDLALRQKNDADDVSSSMSWAILSFMLTDAGERLTATDIKQRINEKVQGKLDTCLNRSLEMFTLTDTLVHSSGTETGLNFATDLFPRPESSTSGKRGWTIQQTKLPQLLDTWTMSPKSIAESPFPLRPLFQQPALYRLQLSDFVPPVVLPGIKGHSFPPTPSSTQPRFLVSRYPSRITSSIKMITQSLDHFRLYVEANLALGVNGDDEKVPYIAPAMLKSYWTKRRVDDILNAQKPPISQSADIIISQYLRIFSILVYIGEPRKISWFCSNIRYMNDIALPLDKNSFPIRCPWASAFLETQWMFSPLIFMPDLLYKRTVPCKTILPVTYERPLTEKCGGHSEVWKVQLHPECCSVSLENEPVVFKVYEGTHAEDFYKAETNVYLKLRSKADNYITKHFASFSFQGKPKFVIVLEYAAGGSLLDFLQNTPLPVEPDDFHLLWDHLSKLLDALEVLHDSYRSDRQSQWLHAGSHQDIQPANILVFPQKDKSAPFDVTFKFTDFGLAEIGRGTMVTKNRGNQMYISPDSYAKLSVRELAKTDVPPSADIWSLGAVFSDVLIWSSLGELGREKYRVRRRREISRQRKLRAADFDACFHDGVERLMAVEDSQNLALQHRRRTDAISPFISKLILEHMLTDVRERGTAMQIRTRVKMGMMRLKNGSSLGSRPLQTNGNQLQMPLRTRVPSVRSATAPSPTHAQRPPPILASTKFEGLQEASQGMLTDMTHLQHSPIENLSLARVISPERPQLSEGQHQKPDSNPEPASTMVTVDMVYQMLEEKDSFNPFMNPINTRAERSSKIMDLPGLMEARSKIGETMGRDQIMIIDNFSSMKRHRQSVMRTARVISYIAKVADTNGVEVYAASEATKKPRVCITSSQVEKAIGKMKTVNGTCNMWRSLDLILDRILVGAKVKPTSICVYTDGIWEPGVDEVRRAIRRAIDHLIRCNQSSSTLMFQFIQFGNDLEGSARLDYLDDECTRQHGNENYNIVDTRRCDDNIREIVIGSISQTA